MSRLDGGSYLLRWSLLGLVAIGSAACQDELVAPDRVQRGQLNSSSTHPARFGLPQGIDEQYVQVALHIPGYGGHYFEDDGTLVVFLKDSAQAGAAREVLADIRAEHQRRERSPASHMTFRHADYDFLQLTRWRGIAAQVVGSIPGVQMIGTSKRENRLHIGVADGTTRDRVTAGLTERGIPAGAVLIEDVSLENIEEDEGGGTDSGSTGSDYLNWAAARLQGGRQVWTEANAINGGGGACTAGLIGRGKAGTAYAGMDVMLTAAHCTRTLDGVNGTWFRQPGSTDVTIGYEEWDAREYYGTYQGYPCAYGEGCRQSDAAIVRLTGSKSAGIGEPGSCTGGGSLRHG